MLLSAALALTAAHAGQDAVYKIVSIERHGTFAGKLGDRVHEALVLEKDGQRFTVSINGDYHTRCVRPGSRLNEGDEIKLSNALSSESKSISRDRISRVRH